jgi:hypothetical protein
MENEKNNMLKKGLGIIFLITAFYLGTYSLYKLFINPHLWLTIKKLFSGYFGTYTIVLIVFNGGYFYIIFLLFKYGLKWSNLLQTLKLEKK